MPIPCFATLSVRPRKRRASKSNNSRDIAVSQYPGFCKWRGNNMEKKFCCAVLGLLCLLALAGCDDAPENAVPYSEEAKGPTGIVIFSARPMQSPINRRTDGFTDGNIIKEKYETDRKTAKMRRGLNTDLAAFFVIKGRCSNWSSALVAHSIKSLMPCDPRNTYTGSGRQPCWSNRPRCRTRQPA